MAAVIAQEFDVVEAVQPFGIVEHHGVAGSLAEGEEVRKDSFDARHVGGDHLCGQDLARFVLARRIADLGGAAAHQDDGLVTGLLQVAQQHDRHQGADMQARRRAVEPDVGGDDAVAERGIQRLRVSALMDEAALRHRVEEFAFDRCHATKRHCRCGPVVARGAHVARTQARHN